MLPGCLNCLQSRFSRRLAHLGLCFLSGSFLFAAPSSAFGRLGENEKALEARFGKPVENQLIRKLDFEQRSYRNHDLMIGVTLIDGRSASEQYMRVTDEVDADGKPVLAPIPEPLAKAILQANAAGGQWEELTPEENKRRFIRSDKEALALFFVKNGVITELRISSSEFNRHLSRFSQVPAQ